MSNSIIYNNFRYTNIKKFIDSLLQNNVSLYLAIGRPYSWNTVTSSDTTIGTPLNTVNNVQADWEDLTSMKRINYSDASFGIRKLLWQAGQKYDAYRQDWDGVTRTSVYDNSYPTCISESKCTVITATGNIYVCLKQAVTAGSVTASLYNPETGTPIGTNTGILKTADNYYWKYIGYNSTDSKFVTSAFYPIKTLTEAPAPSDASNYTQWLAQTQSANFKGGIYAINVVTQGSGYNGGSAGNRVVTDTTTDAQFKIFGNGTGLQLTVTYGSGGTIVDVEVTNPGNGYTYATVVAAGGTNATFDLIYTPITGLGCNPVKDLDATYMLLATTLEGAEGAGDFTVSNDYRKVCLISNPFNYNSTTVATSTTLDVTTTLSLTSVTGGAAAFGSDGIITGSVTHKKGRVVDWDSDNNKLRIINTRYEDYVNYQYSDQEFQTGADPDVLSCSNTVGSGTVVSVIPPEVNLYSGEILYSEYRVPVQRSIEQSETIKIVIQF